jgi:hypothetical protein
MINFETNHHKIVRDALDNKRAVDEQALSSLAVLEERLDRLKKLDKIFDDVQFSSAVSKLLSRKEPVSVC